MIASMRRVLAALVFSCAAATLLAQQSRTATCDPDNGGLTLPQGFCAKVIADVMAPTRHVAVAPNGDIYTVLAVAGGPLAPPPSGPPTPAVVALRDADKDGKYEQQQRFGPGLQGTGILWHDGYLYVGSNTQVVRFKMDGKSLVPSGQQEVIIDALPPANPHSAKSIAIGDGNALYVHVGAPTNACQLPKDRVPGQAGQNPCSQLELHGGVWKYDASQGRPEARRRASIRNRDPAHGRNGVEPRGAAALYHAERPRPARHAVAEVFHRRGQRQSTGRRDATAEAGIELRMAVLLL
jgi:glucose/arabinose dehydrogenase